MQIDVIIPTYNSANFIERAVTSVLAQSYPHFMLHIVDDGSTDNSFELLQQWHAHPQIKIYQLEKNVGVSAARNTGIAHSNAEWISFLDSDDEWKPEKLAKQVAFLKQHPEIEFIHTEETWMRNGVRVNPKLKHSKTPENLFEQSLKHCLISPSTVLMSRKLFLQYGPFDITMPVCEDFDLWNKILAFEKVGYISDLLITKYAGHEDQLSTKFFAMDYWRIQSLRGLLKMKLSHAQKTVVRAQVLNKCEILLKGYLKHGNQEKLRELTAVMEELA